MSRTFKAIDRHGAEMEFELIEATDTLIREGDMIYRKAYSEAIKEGILPREKMREIFDKNGIWTKDDDDEFRHLVADLTTLSLSLEDASKRSDNSECIKISGEMGILRVKMLRLFSVQQASYMQSCEGYAELTKLESLMASCVVIKTTKQRYWKNYKDYVIERDHNTTSNVPEKAMEFNNSLLEKMRDDTINEYPEQKWLQAQQAEIIELAKQEARATLVRRVKEAIDGNKVEGGNTTGVAGSEGANSGGVETNTAPTGSVDVGASS